MTYTYASLNEVMIASDNGLTYRLLIFIPLRGLMLTYCLIYALGIKLELRSKICTSNDVCKTAIIPSCLNDLHEKKSIIVFHPVDYEVTIASHREVDTGSRHISIYEMFHIDPGYIGLTFPLLLLLCGLWCVKIIGYIMARGPYSFLIIVSIYLYQTEASSISE